MLLLFFLFFSFPDDQCVIHFEGAGSYSACIPFNETCYKKVSDFATKTKEKELQCVHGDVAVRCTKQSPQTVKGAGCHQCCYQRFCDKARYFFLEFEALTRNEFVN